MGRIPDRIYLTLGGGLGDVLYTYFKGENGWKWLSPLKEIAPRTRVSVLSSTHNPQTEELIKHNPHIDSFKEFGWVENGRELWEKNKGPAVHIREIKKSLKKISTPKNTKLYLSDSDREEVRKVISQGEFVFIHPFAGLKFRQCLPIEEYIPIIDQLIDDLGYNVVMMGATHNRINFKTTPEMVEEFKYDRDGLFNLVGKTNARVAVRLSQLAHSFIGCWSVYSCAFWIKRGKTTVIITPKLEDQINKRFKPNGRWHTRGDCRVILVDETKGYDKIKDQILSRYREG